MKQPSLWVWAVLLVMMMLPAAGGAQTVYVSDDFEITLRAGPGTDRRIIALPKSGSPLEILERGDEWSQVRMPDGKEGWVLTRYVTTRPPSARVLEQVRREHEALAGKYQELKERYDRLDAAKQADDAELSQLRREHDELRVAHETLKDESSEFLALTERHREVAAELEAEKTRSAQLDEENLQMKRDRIIQWVLAGGGITLVGFLLGLFSAGRRKPRSSLY
jgi:SH3 domain protein